MKSPDHAIFLSLLISANLFIQACAMYASYGDRYQPSYQIDRRAQHYPSYPITVAYPMHVPTVRMFLPDGSYHDVSTMCVNIYGGYDYYGPDGYGDIVHLFSSVSGQVQPSIEQCAPASSFYQSGHQINEPIYYGQQQSSSYGNMRDSANYRSRRPRTNVRIYQHSDSGASSSAHGGPMMSSRTTAESDLSPDSSSQAQTLPEEPLEASEISAQPPPADIPAENRNELIREVTSTDYCEPQMAQIMTVPTANDPQQPLISEELFGQSSMTNDASNANEETKEGDTPGAVNFASKKSRRPKSKKLSLATRQVATSVPAHVYQNENYQEGSSLASAFAEQHIESSNTTRTLVDDLLQPLILEEFSKNSLATDDGPNTEEGEDGKEKTFGGKSAAKQPKKSKKAGSKKPSSTPRQEPTNQVDVFDDPDFMEMLWNMDRTSLPNDTCKNSVQRYLEKIESDMFSHVGLRAVVEDFFDKHGVDYDPFPCWKRTADQIQVMLSNPLQSAENVKALLEFSLYKFLLNHMKHVINTYLQLTDSQGKKKSVRALRRANSNESASAVLNMAAAEIIEGPVVTFWYDELDSFETRIRTIAERMRAEVPNVQLGEFNEMIRPHLIDLQFVRDNLRRILIKKKSIQTI